MVKMDNDDDDVVARMDDEVGNEGRSERRR